MSETKFQADMVTKVGVAATLIFTGFWLFGDRAVSDMDLVLLGLDIVLIGLIGKVVHVLEKIGESINYKEVR